eukprot:4869990-Pyramimonas_sp.AAC.1
MARGVSRRGDIFMGSVAWGRCGTRLNFAEGQLALCLIVGAAITAAGAAKVRSLVRGRCVGACVRWGPRWSWPKRAWR